MIMHCKDVRAGTQPQTIQENSFISEAIPDSSRLQPAVPYFVRRPPPDPHMVLLLTHSVRVQCRFREWSGTTSKYRCHLSVGQQ